ncbi:conserved hypothetical protein [Malacoplasma penetrans HF-2]|uniref:Uncharacterized protein n=1 Tax=Malacoplasma penetrans (strain HF-2) TaxID=272633 RepID=Q8EWM0_MALP2|nr:hypothetical protein [Malacoplasma penetrans]BAC43974.1 conserved hypothetical protein [Malacoplasma penetrans HF-2]
MLTYASIFVTFLIFFNSFAIGKMIQRNYFSLSPNLSFFAGLIIYYIIYALAYVPFILIDDLKQYYVYTVLSIQILLVITYLFSYKSFFISFSFNYKVFSSFLISLITICFCYYLFFHRVEFGLLNSPTVNDVWSIPTVNSFSITYGQLLQFFEKSKITTTDFNLFQRYMFPMIVSIFGSVLVTEFYSIKSFKNIKDIISLLFVSFLLGFFIFNVDKTNLASNSFYEKLLTDSFAFLIFFYGINVFLKKDINLEREPYFFILSMASLLLVFINANYIIISIFIYALTIIFICLKKINFGADALIESSIFMIGCVCIFTLSQYSLANTGSIIIFSLVLAATIILFSIFYILKKNNAKTTYWPFIQKTSIRTNRYFKFIYFTVFLALLIAAFVNIFSKLFRPEEVNLFFDEINLFKFLTNVINYNASVLTKDFTNYGFASFYVIVFLISFTQIWKMSKKTNTNKMNLNHFSFSYFFIFSPFFLYEIKTFSYLLSPNGTYSFDLVFKLLLLFVFGYVSGLFKKVEFIKLDFKFINKINLETLSINYKNNRLKKVFWTIKKPIYIVSNIIGQLVENDYFKFALYSTLISFFTISVFVCNFTQ